MIEEIFKAVGPAAVVPIAAIALAGYVISMLTGWHRTKGQRRIEFLGLWRGVGQMDDMALEVTVRHLFGTYLPASVIRRICASDHCADELSNVTQIWSLFRYDPVGRKVSWVKPRHANSKVLLLEDVLFKALYFLLASIAVGCVFVVFGSGPKSLAAWLYGINALMFGILAIASLAKSETLVSARKFGQQSLDRLGGGVEGVLAPAVPNRSGDARDSKLVNKPGNEAVHESD